MLNRHGLVAGATGTGKTDGIPIRGTMTAFGPTLLAKVLGLNETQESTLGLIFHFADKQGLPYPPRTPRRSRPPSRPSPSPPTTWIGCSPSSASARPS
jgi:hypothetical protein